MTGAGSGWTEGAGRTSPCARQGSRNTRGRMATLLSGLWCFCLPSFDLTEDQRGGSAGNQQAADYLVRGQSFSEKHPREQDDQHYAELVDGRNGRCRTELQRAEVA